MSFLPKTALGKWSVWLIVAFFALVAIGRALVAIEQDGSEIASTSALPVIASVSAMIAGIASFITGVLSIARSRERALTVFLAAGAGGLLILMTIVMFLVSGWFH
ncbi:hypothetical protein Dform_01650 [Dehalogenimonas formicexedens]|uniref:Uncharacterized protein n=1 Tax=Dehalogenimonas formicexedens TaxID=1839801 RepID=A0A1P8F919_9CHLR|nr:hypothetical protein [Dehalogenimonas formicexedens]APV44971.1 hypothetical protein Dform_01650 [Dehalogenimonas formicexedens]